jgi:GTPase SAR1 family protein
MEELKSIKILLLGDAGVGKSTIINIIYPLIDEYVL